MNLVPVPQLRVVLKSIPRQLWIALLALTMATAAFAKDKDLRIPLPKRNKPTPVQQYNRDGVKALEKHDYKKAKQLFYKAYLIDPNDPFTLNNLGYMSELEGDIDRAQRYYDLSADHTSDAMIDMSTDKDLKGKTVAAVAGNTEETGLQVNRLNVEAIGLLRKDRAPEADELLHKALQIDPKNPFSLNNMGFAKEKQGDYESALASYHASADLHSDETIMVAVNPNWRGRHISEVAADNARKLDKLMREESSTQARVARLNTQAVSALNRNDRKAARNFFEQAYKLDPEDAFTLNNMGYLAEMDGDKETAEFYYERARDAKHKDSRVALATRHADEGRKIGFVANESDASVDQRMQADLESKRQQGGPIVLKQRNNQPVPEDEQSTPPVQNQTAPTPLNP